MKSRQKSTLPVAALAFLFLAVFGLAQTIKMPGSTATTEYQKGAKMMLSFDDVPEGTLPPGWKIDATNPAGPLAQWAVTKDAHAPSGSQVLSLIEINDGSRGVFNLCWNHQAGFQDGMTEVKVRANTGTIDQGGGIIWRARDANNYYIARYNPLERNFRLYFVKDGRRQQLADRGDLGIKTGEWFTLKIVHRGDHIEGFLNGEKMWNTKDKTFQAAGGIGFWTKADAVTSFDDLRVN
jgi:hypothetical protein